MFRSLCRGVRKSHLSNTDAYAYIHNELSRMKSMWAICVCVFFFPSDPRSSSFHEVEFSQKEVQHKMLKLGLDPIDLLITFLSKIQLSLFRPCFLIHNKWIIDVLRY
jgi:hypothetical protein